MHRIRDELRAGLRGACNQRFANLEIHNSYGVRSLLSGEGANPKLAKSDALNTGFLSNIMHLLPGSASGHNVCPWASRGCLEACLGLYAGRAGIPITDNTVIEARRLRTLLFFENRSAFYWKLNREIGGFVERCRGLGLCPAIRLNGTSDISWETSGLIDLWPMVQFYDYTKSAKRVDRFLRGELPANYDLTFSVHESNLQDAIRLMENGARCAAVFLDEIPDSWNGFPVINADKSDLRFLDPRSTWCGLLLKASNAVKQSIRAKAQSSGFAALTMERVAI